MPRNIDVSSKNYDALVSVDAKDFYIETFTIKTGQGVILRGTPLGVETATGKLLACDSTNSDGSEAIFAIASKDVDTTAVDVISPVYVEGCFNSDKVLWQGTDTVATHKINARKVGIYFNKSI